jgi:tetratricopeptide (TPR) repeat protein
MTVSLARLRKRAAELEQKKQFEKALEVYMQILDQGGKDLDDEDVPLFNRVGDMLTRKGNVTDALGYYERAVDVYAERGYLNNAIALCSKILRQSPGRATVYYKLARISAKKGFRSDARKNFLEYADRMQKTGQSEEAFRALKEFASLYPDQDDVRLILAELLSKENRKGEALEQLQSLYEKLQSEGRAAEARATVDRMRAIDPSVTPMQGTPQQTSEPSDLVFLDLSDSESQLTTRKDDTPQPVSARAPIPTAVPELRGLDITFLPDDDAPPAPPAGFEPTAIEPERAESDPEPAIPTPEQVDVHEIERTPEPTEVVVNSATPARPSLADVRPIAPAKPKLATPPAIERIEQEIEDLSPVVRNATATTPRSVTPLSSYEFADIELDEVPPHQAERKHDLALPLEIPETPEDSESVSTTALESVAAVDDARAAAEEAADIAADMATRTAAQRPLPADWSPPPQPPTPDEIAAREEREPGAPDELLTPEPTREPVPEVPDDFMSQPPRFGAIDTPPEEHAFPPLFGLDDAGIRASKERPTGPQPPVASIPTPRGMISIGSAESHLRSRLELDPENWDLHRQLGEALLDTGDRDGGLYEFELAMTGFELRGELDRAQEIVDEILSVTPGSVAHHQKRVEFAVKSRDRSRLAHSYLELADALFRTGSADKAVAVYSRVLELDPENERAEFALVTLAPDRLATLRGASVRPERLSDELAALGHGAAVAAPVVADDASVPDEEPDESTLRAATDTPAEVEVPEPLPAPAPAKGPRVRFATLELPVPDWGEGTPARTAAQFARQEAPEEPEAADEPEPVAAVDANDDVEQPRETTAHQEEELPDAAATPAALEAQRTPTPLSTRVATPLSVPAAREATPLSTPATREPTLRSSPVTRQATPVSTTRVPTPPARPRTPTPWSVPVPDVAAAVGGGDSDFVDLGEWLRNTEPARSTRMQVEDPRPTGDEQADFEEMLRRFKRGVAENVDAEDYDAHYDLGVAYKEMGLIDEAIAQFQRALKGPTQRVRSYEALGHCFVEKKQYPIAAALLQRATEVPGSDDQQLVGVLYLLGYAIEQQGRPAEALPYYLRVFAVDIEFRDIAERVAALGNSTK